MHLSHPALSAFVLAITVFPATSQAEIGVEITEPRDRQTYNYNALPIDIVVNVDCYTIQSVYVHVWIVSGDPPAVVFDEVAEIDPLPSTPGTALFPWVGPDGFSPPTPLAPGESRGYRVYVEVWDPYTNDFGSDTLRFFIYRNP